jgi:hypothetical protein
MRCGSASGFGSAADPWFLDFLGFDPSIAPPVVPPEVCGREQPVMTATDGRREHQDAELNDLKQWWLVAVACSALGRGRVCMP